MGITNEWAQLRAWRHGVRHTTLNPEGPGAVRIHLVPPRYRPGGKAPYVVILNGYYVLPLGYAWAVLLENFIDEEYEGRVSGFSSKGMYVKLNNSIEGVIYFTNLNDDYYIYDEEHYSLVGRDFGRRFTMGDKINIKVI